MKFAEFMAKIKPPRIPRINLARHRRNQKTWRFLVSSRLRGKARP